MSDAARLARARSANRLSRLHGGGRRVQPDDFERVNGYSNDYRGWGYEDDDLRTRCQVAGLELAFRDGSYSTLPHPHRGYHDDATPTAEAQATARIFAAKLMEGASAFTREGLSTLDCAVDESVVWLRNGAPQAHIRHHKVALR